MNDIRWEIFLAQGHYEGFEITGSKKDNDEYYITFSKGSRIISESGRSYEHSVLHGLNSIDKYLKSKES